MNMVNIYNIINGKIRNILHRRANKESIVSEWNEKEINEEELDELALGYFNKQWCTSYKSLEEITDDLDKQAIDDFKAGYRKALEG